MKYRFFTVFPIVRTGSGVVRRPIVLKLQHYMGNCLLCHFYLFRHWKHLNRTSLKHRGLNAHSFRPVPPKLQIFVPPNPGPRLRLCLKLQPKPQQLFCTSPQNTRTPRTSNEINQRKIRLKQTGYKTEYKQNYNSKTLVTQFATSLRVPYIVIVIVIMTIPTPSLVGSYC